MPDTPLVDIDRRHLIHPVVNLAAHEQRGPTILHSAHGNTLVDAHGHQVLDAFAGLWCVNVGYGQESIVQAAAEQMRRLPYATGYFHFGNETTIRLAEQLIALTPASLQRVYFTLGGSDAVDAALRYITHYHQSTGRPGKRHVIALDRGYHGATATGAGVTGLPAFHQNFGVPLAWQHHIPCPYAYRHPQGHNPQQVIADSVAALRHKVQELGADQVAAFFCEPIQGSGGVIVPPVGWLKAMENTCRELGILFVVDEVITGFGRTGPMFACEAEGVQPDLMTVAKGLTAGYAPMGAVLVSESVYLGMREGGANGAVLGHGQTYSGHPVSAAVALEVLRLYQEGGILANGQARAAQFAAGLQGLMDHPLVGDARSRGLLGALELVSDKASKARFAPSLKLHERISEAAWRRGLVFRAFGDNILGFAPSLTFSESEMTMLFERLRATLDEVLDHVEVHMAVA